MVLVQNRQFLNFFILGYIAQENVFYDFLETKYNFLDYKTNKCKQSKNQDFSKGDSRWFWSKIEDFSTFLFQAIQPRQMGFIIFQNEKTTFQAIKPTTIHSQKIEIFPKGLVHGFGQKLQILKLFLLRPQSQGKWVLCYSRTKKQLSTL